MDVGFPIFIRIKSRGAHVYLTGFGNAFGYAGLGGDDGVVCDIEVTYDANLAAEHTVLTDLSRAGDHIAGSEVAVFADFHIVCNMHEVIKFYAFA